jgi:hypothetical protein
MINPILKLKIMPKVKANRPHQPEQLAWNLGRVSCPFRPAIPHFALQPTPSFGFYGVGWGSKCSSSSGRDGSRWSPYLAAASGSEFGAIFLGAENYFSLISQDLGRPSNLWIDAIMFLYNMTRTTQTAALVP